MNLKQRSDTCSNKSLATVDKREGSECLSRQI
jgi:hypothetical protein